MPTNKNKEQVENWFKSLRDQICKSFEEIEGQFQHKLVKNKPGRFVRKKWNRLKNNKNMHKSQFTVIVYYFPIYPFKGLPYRLVKFSTAFMNEERGV